MQILSKNEVKMIYFCIFLQNLFFLISRLLNANLAIFNRKYFGMISAIVISC